MNLTGDASTNGWRLAVEGQACNLQFRQPSYNAEQTTVTDQAGKQRKSVVNGLGRLVKVFEDPGSSNFETDYTYDALGNLLQVDQGSQQHRFFTYDSLSRLKTATNPEQLGVATTYDYDDASNLTTRTNPNGASSNVTFTYDGLNRVKSKTLSSGGTWDYTYDSTTISNAKGRLVSVVLHGGTDAYYYDGYDAMGRVTASHQITNSGVATGYAMRYGYDLAGNMTSETYPSGRQVLTEYDSAGRTAGISAAGGYYAGATATDATNRIQYAPQGAVSVMQLGNDKWEHTLFNNRLQPTQIGLGTSGTDSSVMKLDYAYGTTTNNGNVTSQIITAPGLTVNQCYGYDSLNRLSTAEERSGGTTCAGTQQWKQAFSYDRFGNRNFDVVNTTSNVLGPNPTISQSTNRIATGQNYGYDSAGNLTSDPTTPVNGIVYDAENRQTQYNKTGQATNSYYYDGDGHRVKKIDSTGTTVFVYAGGQLIAEYTAGNPSSNGTSYLTSDHLGSTRIVMKADGTTTRHDYLPFGEEIQAGIGGRTTGQGYVADSVRQKFTQKERDNESGLDYFLARYYSSPQGRFTSPDPFCIVFARQSAPSAEEARDEFLGYLILPQQWNHYSYAVNNPLRFVDPTGNKIELTGATEEERKKALERIRDVIAGSNQSLLRSQIQTENVDGHYYVTYTDNTIGEFGGRMNLSVTSVVGTKFVEMIDSDNVIEFQVAKSFTTKAGTFTTAEFSGAATVGSEESLNGHTQIFVHPDAGNVTQEKFGSQYWGAMHSDNGRQLDFYNVIDDAHEFGHAYANAIKGMPIHHSDATNGWSLVFENRLRARLHMPNRRQSH
jgi:RHS repeat-associated protein